MKGPHPTVTSQIHLAETISDLQANLGAALAQARQAQAAQLEGQQAPAPLRVGFVPTMGALHEGHATLIRRAREQNDLVILSIFVNPLQFGPNEDYDRYPRTLEADLVLAAEAGVDLVFAPSLEEIYPGGDPKITVVSGKLGTLFEGKTRPGHFDGVLTVVNKFFNILKPLVGPDSLQAYFGQKDAQQLALIQRMVKDFNHQVTLKAVPVVRADDGLALSSRNQYLSPQEREAALVLSRSLATLREKNLTGTLTGEDIDQARQSIQATEGVRLDYLEVVDTDTFEAPQGSEGHQVALVAAYVGATRLIDNMDIN